MTKIGIPKEINAGEKRVSATPETVIKLKKLGYDVAVESGAGEGINVADAEYQEAGAEIIPDTNDLWGAADIVLKVRPPETNENLHVHEADLLKKGATLIGFIWPGQHKDVIERMAKRKATVFAMDSIPRITRAQKMDTLSAMANIAGYRAVIEAAAHFPRFFTGQITAAGKIDPAKVLVIGAGVAGLSAIGAAKGLGAIVRAFDPRSATKDQVASMGAEFLELDVKEEGEGKGGYAKEMSDAFLKAEMALFAQQAMQVDIIITTALIPGKPAPKLITTGMVESMKPGSVIVDLAAEQGGNCEFTERGQTVVKHGVTIIGAIDHASHVAVHASQMWSRNMEKLIFHITKDGALALDSNDEIVRGCMIIREGEIVHAATKAARAASSGATASAPT